MSLQPLGKQLGGDQEMIELGHCIALHYLVSTRYEKEKESLFTVYLTVGCRGGRERCGGTYLTYMPVHVCSSAYSRE